MDHARFERELSREVDRRIDDLRTGGHSEETIDASYEEIQDVAYDTVCDRWGIK